MRIFYAIQGTGNGHISREKEIVPLLRKRCETDVLVSSDQWDIRLPFSPVYEFTTPTGSPHPDGVYF